MKPCPTCKGSRRVIVLFAGEHLNRIERMTSHLGFYRVKCPECYARPTEPVAADFPAYLPPHPGLISSATTNTAAGTIEGP